MQRMQETSATAFTMQKKIVFLGAVKETIGFSFVKKLPLVLDNISTEVVFS